VEKRDREAVVGEPVNVGEEVEAREKREENRGLRKL